MSGEDNQDRDRTVGERIAEVIRSNEQAPKKNLTEEEVRALKAAAERLEQLLSDAANAETEALKSAASRLDQLLKDIGAGKDVAPGLRIRDK
jgi:predicted DNA-binding transcriptional regulator YafY